MVSLPTPTIPDVPARSNARPGIVRAPTKRAGFFGAGLGLAGGGTVAGAGAGDGSAGASAETMRPRPSGSVTAETPATTASPSLLDARSATCATCVRFGAVTPSRFTIQTLPPAAPTTMATPAAV